METAREELKKLFEGERRIRVLELLVEGPKTKGEVMNDTSYSESSARKQLGKLSKWGWVTNYEEGGKYQATPLGEFILPDLRRVMDTMQKATLLRAIPYSEMEDRGDGLDLSEFQGEKADVTTIVAGKPEATLDRVIRLVQDASKVQALSPLASQGLVYVFGSQIAHEGLEAELIFNRDILVQLATEYGDEGRQLIESESTKIYMYDDRWEIPFPIAIIDDTVGIGIQDQYGNLYGLIESQSPAVLDWAEEYYRYHRGNSEPQDEDSLKELRDSKDP